MSKDKGKIIQIDDKKEEKVDAADLKELNEVIVDIRTLSAELQVLDGKTKEIAMITRSTKQAYDATQKVYQMIGKRFNEKYGLDPKDTLDTETGVITRKGEEPQKEAKQ